MHALDEALVSAAIVAVVSDLIAVGILDARKIIGIAVARCDALAAMEPFHRAGQEIGRFGYVHLSDASSIMTVTGKSSGHLHVEAKFIPQGEKIASCLNAATDVQTSMAVLLVSRGTVADCAGDLHLALHEVYGRSVPATVYVGGYVTDLVTVDLAAALGRLRGSELSVCPAAELDYAIAIGG